MIGERLKGARLAAGLSQESLAQAVGVSKMAVSKYERNLAMPGSRVLLALAQALEVRPEQLFRPAPRMLASVGFRCRPDLAPERRRKLKAQAQDLLERYLDAEALVGQVSEFVVPDTLPRPVRTDEDIESAAEALRQAWSLGSGPIENLADVLESHGVKVELIEAEDDLDGVLCHLGGDRPVIAVNRAHPGDRQRFTMAHELGHLVLSQLPHMHADKAANRFAGAFLVPAAVVRAELGLKRHSLDLLELHLLKHKYGMSMQAWIHRARECGIIADKTKHELLDLFAAKGWDRTEPGDQIPREEPLRLERLVRRALAEELITESRAAELLAVSVAEFRHLEAEKHQGFPVGLRA